MPSTLLTVCLKELKDHIRDRRTTLMIFILSVAIGPLILIGLTRFIASVEEKALEKEIYVEGQENAPILINFLLRQDIKIKEPEPGFMERVKEGLHDSVLVIPKDFSKNFAAGTAQVDIVYDDSNQDTGRASYRVLRNLILQFNSEAASQRLIYRGVSPKMISAVEVNSINLGTQVERAARILFIVAWLTLLGCISGATGISIDVTAGERERGSLEPLLMNPISRIELVIGKWLAVTIYGLIVPILTLIGFVLTLKFVPMPSVTSMLTIEAPQFMAISLTVLSFAPAMASLQMLIATFGRSHKEAQTSVSYMVMVASFAPAIVMFAQIKDGIWQLFIPMFAQLMVITRILGSEPVGLLHFAVPLVVNIAICVFALSVIAKLLQKENIIYGRQ